MEWLGSGSEDDDDDDEDEENGDDDDEDEDGMETDWCHPAGASSSKKFMQNLFLQFFEIFFRVLLIGPGSMKSLTKYKYPVEDLVW